MKPLVIVSTLLPKDRETVVNFLIQFNAPVYLEAISGIREEPRLEHLKIGYIQKLWQVSEEAGYSIDAILRIGGVPTLRPWRDLEDKKRDIPVISFSHLPFSGLSRAPKIRGDLNQLEEIDISVEREGLREWLEVDRICLKSLEELIHEEPLAEPSLFRQLSESIPRESFVYLGNSLPIREWDLAATYESRGLDLHASRGLNGIDGQLSTFLGMATPNQDNWGIFGDLTTLYDLSAPWILNQMRETSITLVVVNNSGGKIFSRMFPHPEFQNCHHFSFEAIAKHWGLSYYREERALTEIASDKQRLIELIPDQASTERFWKKGEKLGALQTA